MPYSFFEWLQGFFIVYSTIYRQYCTRQAFEQFGALYIHNDHDKYPSRPGFEPSTSRLQAPVDTNEPSGPAIFIQTIETKDFF